MTPNSRHARMKMVKALLVYLVNIIVLRLINE